MHAIVVYESVWGNTAAIARAIAEGLGAGTRAYPTDEVPAALLASVDLIVAGAPVFGFRLPTEGVRDRILRDEADAPRPPTSRTRRSDRGLTGFPIRARTTDRPVRSAAFETRIWWSPRGATGTIEKRLARLGYPPLAPAEKFVVRDKYGPLREGELERARAWGRALRLGASAALNEAA